MTYTTKKLPKSRIEISVILTADEFKTFESAAMQDFVQKAELPGFRPGKAPLELVKEKVNATHIRERAAERAVQKHYVDIIKKENLDVIGHPDITMKNGDNDVMLTIIASLFPEIRLPDYKAIAQKINKGQKTQTIDEKEISDSLKWLRESRVKHVTVPRAAQKGDRIEVDFTVTDNGVIIEGGSSKNHPLIIGEGKFIPGFEDAVIGMREKEERNFKLTMPKDYPNNLGGKELNFRVAMKLVQERILPEITDDFAKGLGTFSTVEELKKSIREGLLKEKVEKERQRLDMTIAEEIVKQATPEIPDLLIERETEKMLHEFEASVSKMGMEMEKYLEHIKKTSDDLKKEWLPDAEKRVKIALALRAIADKEKIEPTDEEVSTKANNSLDIFRTEGHDITQIDKRALTEYSRNILRNERVFEFLENIK